MALPRPTAQQIVGGTLGVIAVALGVRMLSSRNEPDRGPMQDREDGNERGHYGHKKHDHDKKKHKDHDDKKHKHHDDDDD